VVLVKLLGVHTPNSTSGRGNWSGILYSDVTNAEYGGRPHSPRRWTLHNKAAQRRLALCSEGTFNAISLVILDRQP